MANLNLNGGMGENNLDMIAPMRLNFSNEALGASNDDILPVRGSD